MERFLEYFGWLVGSWYGMLWLIAFGLTLGLQAARRRMSQRRYAPLWQMVLLLGGMWGGFALLGYVPKLVQWYDAYFLIPGVLAAVGLAKLQQRLPGRIYLVVVLNVAVVIFATRWVMAQYTAETTPRHNFWVAERLKFGVHEWVIGRGWPGMVVPSGGGQGPGVGGFMMLSSRGEP